MLASAVGALVTASAVKARAQAPRVLHVDSYHQGNEWNDRIAAECRRIIEGAGGQWRIFHLDAKRRPAPEQIEEAARRATEIVAEWKPDVLTTSDDPAAEYLIMRYYRDADLPVVFCGVNWDASVYGLPYTNTAGMVEVSAIPQIISLMRPLAKGDRLGLITEETPTKRKEMKEHIRLFDLHYDRTWFVSDFEAWTEGFLEAQEQVDMLLLLGVGAVTDWDDRAARRLAQTRTAIPTGTDFPWLMPYALLGVGKRPEEQGRFAAETALAIAAGTDPRDIPIAYNTEGDLLFNPLIARHLGVAKIPPLATLVD
ncbi:ABC transporter substrate-binding protein [Acuticoccus sediminis]|uniref:ABC transporter substrate-binding protein n=1 Tax=Acuticoccus sediminis TaxID=2184697 RepID=A0A8B2NI60_9HYPH|nr:ABC transporter substrate-binding protein [Acuticoccus sediminis]RAH99012.1 ABC transporter substrate-binding protein [Acuticoccus sediminis]